MTAIVLKLFGAGIAVAVTVILYQSYSRHALDAWLISFIGLFALSRSS